ncbi:MAG: MBL fold metallo-hydrolase [Alphaproteobacteria bacterium]|nr:MBL fold metallo-hydrolase [Alphaproteobacteria bacterium]
MSRSLLPALSACFAVSTGCTVSQHPVAPADLAARRVAPTEWASILADAAVVEHEAVTSARWAVPLSGLVDLDDPAAAAALADGDAPIVLPVHVLRHPVHGVFVVDTGIDRDLAAGGRGATRGLVSAFLSELEPVEPLADIVARQPAPLAGVLLTHVHLDHVLGLPDVPVDTPVYVGAEELTHRSAENGLMRSTYRRLLADRPALVGLDAAGAVPGEGLVAFDLLGDGSLWGLSVPGHTPGSMAWLANTADGPVLLTGDCSHTVWGWEHGVTPGTFTVDHDGNAVSLAALRAVADALPGVQVFVGHELPGEPGPLDGR